MHAELWLYILIVCVCMRMFMLLYVADNNAHKEFGFAVLSCSPNDSASCSQHVE